MNPYQKLPKSSFWRSGVVEDQQFINIHAPKWDIDTSDCIVTMGSCFAQHVGKKLKSNGFNVPYFDTADGVKSKSFSANYGNIYTVRQALQLLQETNGSFSRDEKHWEVETGYLDPLRPNVFLSPFKSKDELDINRQFHLKSVRRAIEELDVLVFTLGLTEAWERVSCKSVLPVIPGVLGGSFNEANYKFHNFNYTEVSSDLSSLIEEILFMRNDKKFKLLLTVSPVPLTATAETRHVLTSTVASKSILRAVADEFARNFEFIDYFPSFEIVTNPKLVAENYEQNLRNVKQSSVDKVMEIFHSTYVKGDVNFDQNNSTNMLDEVGDIDCEEALLDQFEKEPLGCSDDRDILFYGNSHLGFMRTALSKEIITRSIFVPINFLNNDPISDIESSRFQSFYFNDQRFTDVAFHNCKVLVVVGYGILGDGIVRALGPLKAGFKGCLGQNISPSLSPIMLHEGEVRTLFKRQLEIRIRHLQKISTQNLFEKIICIVSPDMPEKVARFRFGDIFVDSKTFINYKRIYIEELQKRLGDLDQKISFILHDDKELYTDTGFVKDIYAGPKKWDYHPHEFFYKDSKVESKLIALINNQSDWV